MLDEELDVTEALLEELFQSWYELLAVRTMADGQRDFLHGVIEFYQTRTSTHLTVAAEKAASTAVRQNDLPL